VRKLAFKDNYVSNHNKTAKIKKKISKGSDLHLTLNFGREETQLDNEGNFYSWPKWLIIEDNNTLSREESSQQEQNTIINSRILELEDELRKAREEIK